MRNIVIATLVVILFSVSPLFQKKVLAENITLGWDAVEYAPDGYKLFHRIEGQTYDYNIPLTNSIYIDGIIPPDATTFVANITQGPELGVPDPCSISDASWNKQLSVVNISWVQPVTIYELNHYFVIRSFLAEQESVDSNEVSYAVKSKVPISYWNIYYSETPGGPWVLLGKVDNIGQLNPVTTVSLTTVAPGERKTIYFTVVSFTSDSLFSNNSNEVSVDVDRRILQPPTNLRVVVTIPVE